MGPDSSEEHVEAHLPASQWTLLKRLNVTVPLDPHIRLLVQRYDEVQQRPHTYTIKDEVKEEGDHEVITYTYPRVSSPSLELFLGAMAEAMGVDESFDVFTPNPTKAFDDKIDTFLQHHAGITYTQFAQGVRVRNWDTNDYAILAPGLRRKLFDSRARIYLAALATTEASGYNLHTVLEEISQAKILPLKKEEDEPTFTYIKSTLKKK